MRVALTGGTGFLGSHAAEALLRAGHEVVVLARDPAKAERVLARHGAWPLPVVAGDMADTDAVRRLLQGCDAVVQAAAAFYGDERVLRANVAGVENVLGIGAELGLDPLIYVSTIAVMFPPRGEVITVDDPISSPRTTYGRSKAAGEQFARDMQARGSPVVIVYPGAIQGPDDPGPTEGSKGVRDRLRFGWPRTSGGLPLVDVRDVAAVITAACAPGRGPRRYMAGGNFLTWMQEADLCEEITGRRVRRIPAPAAVLRTAGHAVDLMKWLVPSFDYPLTREAAEFITQIVPCDSRATTAELGVHFRPARETLLDTIRWLYDSGELPAQYAGRVAAAGAAAAPL